MPGPRVLLVQMPFGSLRWPSPALGLLEATCKARGIACHTAYFTFDLAERIGLPTYEWIAESFGFVLGGERLFAKHYFADAEGVRLPDDESYFREVLRASDPLFAQADRREFEAIGHCVPSFLDACLAAVDWSAYDVVGFAASLQQVMPSLCLARRVRDAGYRPTIVLGGAACDGPMGTELLRKFEEIDYLFLGEADLTFPHFLDRLAMGKTPDAGIGIVARAALGRDEANEAAIVRDLDALPTPDYDAYFDRLRRSPLAGEINPLLLLETSRGCWWGAARHCHFCGLNGSRIAYRSKDPRGVVDEMVDLVDRHRIRKVCTTDNVLDPGYFATLLPLLEEAKLGIAFEQELRTAMSREDIQLLTRAGLAAAQLGVETFITRILQRIDKGTRALDNLQTLKWLTEAGVQIHWNFLYGFPEETPSDYGELPELIRSIVHFAPPRAWGPVRLDRFSPYFKRPAAHGLVGVRPKSAFAHVYPFEPESLQRLAYYFDFEYADGRVLEDYVQPTLEAIKAWSACHDTATLCYWDRPDGVLLLTDTRPAAAGFQYRLSGRERSLYLFCDRGRTAEEIAEFIRSVEPSWTWEPARRLLDEWMARRLMLRVDGRYLALALRSPEA